MAPQQSATKSQTSPSLPICIAFWIISITPPNSIDNPPASKILMLPNLCNGFSPLSALRSPLLIVVRTQRGLLLQISIARQSANPPNIIPCTTLSAPGNRLTCISPSGLDTNVRYMIRAPHTIVNDHAGKRSNIFSSPFFMRGICGIFIYAKICK